MMKTVIKIKNAYDPETAYMKHNGLEFWCTVSGFFSSSSVFNFVFEKIEEIETVEALADIFRGDAFALECIEGARGLEGDWYWVQGVPMIAFSQASPTA